MPGGGVVELSRRSSKTSRRSSSSSSMRPSLQPTKTLFVPRVARNSAGLDTEQGEEVGGGGVGLGAGVGAEVGWEEIGVREE